MFGLATLQTRVIGISVALALLVGAFRWVYFHGKSVARQECLQKQLKVQQKLEAVIEKAEEKNREQAKKLAETESKLARTSRARVKRIIKYVEKDLNSNDVIFDADGLRILNEAQKGVSTGNK